MPLSADLAAKSVQAAVAAIEIYNKPSFTYREEAFSLLMTNAWELLLKAKWLADSCRGCRDPVRDDQGQNRGSKAEGES